MMWAAFLGLAYAGITADVPAFAVWWVGAVVVALAATFAGAWSAFRRSERAARRTPW